MVSLNFSWITSSPGSARNAMAIAFFTNGNCLILINTAESVVRINTWFSHFDWLMTCTPGTAFRLSIYAGVTGRSVESIVNCWRIRRLMEACERYAAGALVRKGD